jgi:hypothetical protein
MLLDRTHRRWAVGCLLVTLLATAVYVPHHIAGERGASGGTAIGLAYGSAGLALMLYAGALGLRRKVPSWRVGRGETWMRGHLWLGLLIVPMILFHGGFRLGGGLTTLLMALTAAVVLSGMIGVALQQVLPRLMLEQLPLETVYEQIDEVVGQLRTQADELVAAVTGPLPVAAPVTTRRRWRLRRVIQNPRVSDPRPRRQEAVALTPGPETDALRHLYLNAIRPYLVASRPPKGQLAAPATAGALFSHLRLTLPPPFHEAVDELQAITDERRQLANQKRLHHLLHGWLLFHVPLSMALLLLAAVHAVMALRY